MKNLILLGDCFMFYYIEIDKKFEWVMKFFNSVES